jgi:hypothetical protein
MLVHIKKPTKKQPHLEAVSLCIEGESSEREKPHRG